MGKQRILVADKIGAAGLEVLAAAEDVEVDIKVGLGKEELLGIIDGYQAVIVRSATTLDGDIIEAGAELVVIGRAGVGVDNIDVSAATRRGLKLTLVRVVNSAL